MTDDEKLKCGFSRPAAIRFLGALQEDKFSEAAYELSGTLVWARAPGDVENVFIEAEEALQQNRRTDVVDRAAALIRQYAELGAAPTIS